MGYVWWGKTDQGRLGLVTERFRGLRGGQYLSLVDELLYCDYLYGAHNFQFCKEELIKARFAK